MEVVLACPHCARHLHGLRGRLHLLRAAIAVTASQGTCGMRRHPEVEPLYANGLYHRSCSCGKRYYGLVH